ncbi:MAG: tRNA-dihydrouridine synthase family protein [Deinococcota bacterium]
MFAHRAVNFYTQKLEQPRAILAPMAGYTDAPFRKLCREYGSAWAVTEMVSAKALVVGDLQGIEIGEPYAGEPDLVIQVFGGEPDIVAAGGRILYDTYQPQALDINMGCPVKKVTGKSCGSKLMQDPDRAANIVQALAEAVPVPVSAKMRLGYDMVNVLEVATALEEAGASLIAIHGRTAAQKYSGEANWDTIVEVASQISIPVVGSGDVHTKAQFDSHRAQGLGVMVARAAVGRPWIFAELSGNATTLTQQELAELVVRHAAMNVSWYGEIKGILPMRSHCLKYFREMPTFTEMRPDIIKLQTLEDVYNLVTKWLNVNIDLPTADLDLIASDVATDKHDIKRRLPKRARGRSKRRLGKISRLGATPA